MLISGEWFPCDDGIVRPVIRGEVLAGDGSWKPALLLVDTGADRTVFSAGILAATHFRPSASDHRLAGLGGVADSVLFETSVRLTREGAGKVVFHGQYAGVTDPQALDMSVLGRDISGSSTVIVERPGDVVCLVGQRHHYTIERS